MPVLLSIQKLRFHAFTLFVAALTVVSGLLGTAQAETLRIVGSSTVYPFSASVAEHLAHRTAYAPVVEATGTGAGFKLFCAGSGPRFPDITNASRPMLESERAHCAQAGVTSVLEVKIGMDGITLAQAKSAAAPMKLTRLMLFKALARALPVHERWQDNPYTNWRQIDPSLPARAIRVYGAPPVSGTRDTFVELVMQEGCRQMPEFAQFLPDRNAQKLACSRMREDGAFIEAGENGNLIVQKLLADSEALGIVGYNFLKENGNLVEASPIDGVSPDFASIQNNSYPLARLLYAYVKPTRLGSMPAIAAYVKELTSEAAMGDRGYLMRQGLVPLMPERRAKLREEVENVFLSFGAQAARRLSAQQKSLERSD
jgi:phosphate transport system substrate-binding protein